MKSQAEPLDDLEDRLEVTRAWWQQDKARRWLADNVRRAKYLRLTDRRFLQELRSITSHDDPVSLLDALCEFLETRNRRFQRAVATRLARLAIEHPGPGRDAVIIDRAIRRLLHRLSDPVGRPVAIASLRSNRRDRRSAAWKFYRRHGLDEESRGVLADEFGCEDHEEYRKLITNDAQLVLRIGVHEVAAVAPNRYWRSKVVEAVLGTDAQLTEELRRAYPAEWLWAVSRKPDDNNIQGALGLLRANIDDVDLVNRVLLCVTQLGNREAIEETLSAAEWLLEQPAPPEPDWTRDGASSVG